MEKTLAQFATYIIMGIKYTYCFSCKKHKPEGHNIHDDLKRIEEAYYTVKYG